jgi:hypothetical protein
VGRHVEGGRLTATFRTIGPFGKGNTFERLMEVEEGINCCSNNHKTEPDASKYLQNRCCFQENFVRATLLT